MKKFILIITILNLPQWTIAQTGYSIKQCIDIATQNSLVIKQRGLQLETAETNYNQAKNNRLPNINGQYGIGVNNGLSIDPITNLRKSQELVSSNVGIGAGVTVYNGGRLQNQIKQFNFGNQAAKNDVEQEKNVLTLNVILAYLQILNNEDLLKLANAQLVVTKKQLERLEIMNKSGAIQPATLFDMKAQFASDELAIANSENALLLSKLTLTQLMNISFDKNFLIDRADFPSISTDGKTFSAYTTTAQAIIDEANREMPLIKAAEMRQQSAIAAIKVAKSNYFPTVSLQAQIGSNYSSLARNATAEKIPYFNQIGDNRNSFIGANVQIPIFNAFQSKTLVSLAKIQEKTAINQIDLLKLQLRQDIEQAHLTMQNSFNRYVILTRQVEALKQSFAAAEKRFTEGVMHAVDYLIIKNNLDRATANWVNAQYDYLLRVKVLDFYRGN